MLLCYAKFVVMFRQLLYYLILFLKCYDDIKVCFMYFNVVKCNLTLLTMRSKRYTCGHCCLALRCVLALQCVLVLQCVLALRCTLSVVLFPQASSVLFYPYLQYVHLATVALKKCKSNLKNFMDQIWMHIL